MSNFSVESHSLRTHEERKKARKAKSPVKIAKWDAADKIVGLVYCDLINGLSTSDIIDKFAQCLYEGQEKPIKMRTAQDYIRAARNRMELDFQYEADQLRHDLYAKMLAVYADAVEHNDRYNALIALDKIMKLTGCAVEKQQNNIQLNATSSGVTINFGFKKDEENVEE
jgi:hypothetical protein